MAKLPKYIKDAILSGPIPKFRDWEKLPVEKLTAGEKVLRFAADYLRFPEGKLAGKPLRLDPFQQAFVLAAFSDNPHIYKAILSVGRRNGKTLVMAVIVLAFVVGPFARQNSMVCSAAMTREQAGLLWRLMDLICAMSPALENRYSSVPSSKKLVGLSKNVEYQALSRDAKSGHGKAIYVLVLDEAGQIEAPHDDYLDMLFSSMGTYEDAKTFIISTQAPSDASFLSLEIDAATRDQPKNVVCHLYAAPTDDLMDRKGWKQANPGLMGGYRSLRDIEAAAMDAVAIPAKQTGFLNLFLNRRVARESLWLAPAIWKENGQPPDMDTLRANPVAIGLDLSARNDLTAAVVAGADANGVVSLLPFVFTPSQHLEARAKRDKVPYDVWVKEGQLIALPGATIDYGMVAEYLRNALDDLGIAIGSIEFDRWRIDVFKTAANEAGFAQVATWHEVGQGFKDFSPRCEAFETLLLQKKIRHGNHPLFNMAVASAIAVRDPAGSIKLDKSKSTARIDPLVAAVMAAYPMGEGREETLGNDLAWWVA